jgi:hypothetical protein
MSGALQSHCVQSMVYSLHLLAYMKLEGITYLREVVGRRGGVGGGGGLGRGAGRGAEEEQQIAHSLFTWTGP